LATLTLTLFLSERAPAGFDWLLTSALTADISPFAFERNIPYSGYAPTHAGCPAYCRNYAGFFYNAYYGASYCVKSLQVILS